MYICTGKKKKPDWHMGQTSGLGNKHRPPYKEGWRSVSSMDLPAGAFTGVKNTLFFQKMRFCPSCESPVTTRGTENSQPFTFTGKERDRETGFSYFGARYYDSDLSGLFMSVDPMADKYPNISPYHYCHWNPIKLVDPDGLDTINIDLDKGTIKQIKAEGDHSIFYYKNGEIAGSDQFQRDNCSFRTNSYDLTYIDGNEKNKCHNEHLKCSNIEIGERIFIKMATIGSSVEWDYYSIREGYGDLSSSGIADKMIHFEGAYTADNVNFWDHYHPYNSSEGFYPSYADQDHARDLQGARCTIFFDGRLMDFDKYVPSNKNGYISMHKFRELWNRFAR